MTREDVKYFANCLKNNYKMDFNTMEMFCNAVIESQNKLQKIENIMNEMPIDTIVKKLEKETVSRESYDHEYFLRNKFEVKAWKLERIIEDLKQDTLDDAREDFMFDVYKILDFLPTNNEANQIIDVFDRITSGLKLSKDCALKKVRAEIEDLPKTYPFINHFDMYVKEDDVKRIIDKYREENEE